MNVASDESLMIAVREDHLSELGVLFERHHARIYQFCLRMTGSPAASEDLVQEVFMRMLKYRHTFRDSSRYLPWMYRLARNCCIDHFRRRGREQPSSRSEECRVEPPSGEPSAQATLEDRESVNLLRRALLRLPVEKREVLILSRFESRRYEEIAELLECTAGAVKVRAHRALRELRRAYYELLSEVST